MAVYTPGALSAIFNNSKSEVSDAKEKSDDKLVKLFSKASSNKRNYQNTITTDETSDNATAKKLKSKPKNDEAKKNKVKEENKIEIDTKIIGPTVIPSAQSVEEELQKENDPESNEDEEFDQEKPKYTKPSRKYQVKEEDKKKPQFDDEKESRTIFVGNLPNKITGKILKRKVIFSLKSLVHNMDLKIKKCRYLSNCHLI